MARFSEVEVRLAAQQALLDEAFPALRAIRIEWTDARLTCRSFVDGVIDNDAFDSLGVFGTELLAQFPPDMQIDESFKRCDVPRELPDGEGILVFLRDERADSSDAERSPGTLLPGRELVTATGLVEACALGHAPGPWKGTMSASLLAVHFAALGNVVPPLKEITLDLHGTDLTVSVIVDEALERPDEAAICRIEHGLRTLLVNVAGLSFQVSRRDSPRRPESTVRFAFARREAEGY